MTIIEQIRKELPELAGEKRQRYIKELLLPEYDAGIFNENNTTMVVSRGLGNSIVPVRINNSPEVVIVTLSQK